MLHQKIWCKWRAKLYLNFYRWQFAARLLNHKTNDETHWKPEHWRKEALRHLMLTVTIQLEPMSEDQQCWLEELTAKVVTYSISEKPTTATAQVLPVRELLMDEMRRQNMIKKNPKVLSVTTRPMQDARAYWTAEAEEFEADERPPERSQQYEPHRTTQTDYSISLQCSVKTSVSRGTSVQSNGPVQHPDLNEPRQCMVLTAERQQWSLRDSSDKERNLGNKIVTQGYSTKHVEKISTLEDTKITREGIRITQEGKRSTISSNWATSTSWP